MQVLPSTTLSPYIKHYLFLESKSDSVKQLRLFSDGNTGMVFCLHESTIAINESNHLPVAFIYGQISSFKDLYLSLTASLVIVVFQPDGLHKLLGIPAAEIKDRIVPAEDIFGTHSLSLNHKLLHPYTMQDKIKALDTFFLTLNNKQLSTNQLLIQVSLQFIARHNGCNTISQLVQHTGYSERHIERAFSESIGISPKKFSNIVKLHSFLKILKNKTRQANLTPYCYDAGYFDQSHLIKEFKKYTGVTPTDYLQNSNRLTTNLMEFNTANKPMSGLYNFSL